MIGRDRSFLLLHHLGRRAWSTLRSRRSSPSGSASSGLPRTIAGPAGLRWPHGAPDLDGSSLIAGSELRDRDLLHDGADLVLEEYATTGSLPSLTWVPAVVILFPLILPGGPSSGGRRRGRAASPHSRSCCSTPRQGEDAAEQLRPGDGESGTPSCAPTSAPASSNGLGRQLARPRLAATTRGEAGERRHGRESGGEATACSPAPRRSSSSADRSRRSRAGDSQEGPSFRGEAQLPPACARPIP